VWVDGGIHARVSLISKMLIEFQEWASIHTALYFIDQLVGNYGIDGQITGYVNTLNFYIVPCLNPDGYEFTRSAPHPQVLS
jgi:murein tripeptide amidase MpaA